MTKKTFSLDEIQKELDRLQTENKQLRDEVLAYKKSIRYVKKLYPVDLFPPKSDSIDSKCAKMARKTCDNIVYEKDKFIFWRFYF